MADWIRILIILTDYGVMANLRTIISVSDVIDCYIQSHHFRRLFAVLQQAEYLLQKWAFGVSVFGKARTIDNWRTLYFI